MSAPQILKHMMPRDIPVFCTYVLTPEGQSFTSWEFDMIVGSPNDPGPMYPMNKRMQALYLNALKIDAIGWFFNTPTVIECKPDAGLGAIGQVDGYANWFRRFFGVLPGKMIVCESMREQVQTIATDHEIQIRIVPPANNLQIEQALRYVTPLIQPSPLGPNPLAPFA
jgi:hypothetical protein